MCCMQRDETPKAPVLEGLLEEFAASEGEAELKIIGQTKFVEEWSENFLP
jgi:hypothetical protein